MWVSNATRSDRWGWNVPQGARSTYHHRTLHTPSCSKHPGEKETAGLRLTHWTVNLSGQCPEKAGHYGNRPPAKVSIAVNWLNTYYHHIFWTRLVVLDIAVPIIVKGFGRNPNVTSVRFTFPAAIPISNLQPGCYEKYIAQHVDRCRLPEDTNKPHRPFPMKQRMGAKWQSEKREHTPNWLGKSSSESIHLHFLGFKSVHFPGIFFQITSCFGSCHCKIWRLQPPQPKAPTSNAAQSIRLLHRARQKSSGNVKFPFRSSNS